MWRQSLMCRREEGIIYPQDRWKWSAIQWPEPLQTQGFVEPKVADEHGPAWLEMAGLFYSPHLTVLGMRCLQKNVKLTLSLTISEVFGAWSTSSSDVGDWSPYPTPKKYFTPLEFCWRILVKSMTHS